nr:unnamed protein product [Digitaria exilis]
MAAKKKKRMLNRSSGSISLMGTPLRERALPRDDLADEREGDAELGEAADEELVGLGESEERAPLAEPERGAESPPRRDDGALEPRGVVDEAPPVAERADGAQEREEDEEEQQRLRLVDGDPRLEVELREDAPAGDGLAEEGGGEAEHGDAADEELVLLGEADAAGCAEDAVLHAGTPLVGGRGGRGGGGLLVLALVGVLGWW